jgi:hypothetical protein
MVGQGARHRNAAQCDHVENRRATAKEQPEQRAPIEQLRPESRPCPHLASGVPAPPSSWRWQQQRGPVGRHASVRAAAALRSTERAQDHRLHCADRAPDTGIEPWRIRGNYGGGPVAATQLALWSSTASTRAHSVSSIQILGMTVAACLAVTTAPCVREVVARIGLDPLGARTSRSGSIRTGVQGSDRGATVAAGEFVGGAGISRGWSECSDTGALACGRVGPWIWRSSWRQSALDGGSAAAGVDHHSWDG